MLSKKPKPYIIPEYSLTGDLLAHLRCPLQYRYNSKGALPPSTPVQLWFGEFIHGVMEEGFLRWRDENLRTFPWPTDQINKISIDIADRLRARKLFSNPNVFCRYSSPGSASGCPDGNHPHMRIANLRAISAINTWGPSLFPLIIDNEVRLDGMRPMPNFDQSTSRSNFYGITGFADVISSIQLSTAPPGNLIIEYLIRNAEVKKMMEALQDFEILIDYKGTRRPALNDPEWQYYDWQILTYMSLRSVLQNPRKVVAGILLFLNELEPIQSDLDMILHESQNGNTDVPATGQDLLTLTTAKHGQKNIPRQMRIDRSIRVIPYDQEKINHSLGQFDNVVANIENCVSQEMNGHPIQQCWRPGSLERTCTACDAKSYCNNPSPKSGYPPTAP